MYVYMCKRQGMRYIVYQRLRCCAILRHAALIMDWSSVGVSIISIRATTRTVISIISSIRRWA